MKTYIIETQSIVLKIYVINFSIYIIKFPVIFKYRSSHWWCSLNNIFIKSSQYSQETSVLEFLFNQFIGLQTCNFTKKRLQHSRFHVNIANVKNTYFKKHLETAGSDSSYILHIAKLFRRRLGFADWSFVSSET